MISRPAIASLVWILFVNMAASAQLAKTLPFAETAAGVAALQGQVLSPDGKPASGIYIELDELKTATPITSTYTQSDGTFELYNIAQGDYEIVAESESSEVSHPVRLEAGSPKLELRLPKTTVHLPDSSPQVVSVTQMLVPERARKIYSKAVDDFHRGKIAQAKALLSQALIIEPQYADALALQGVLYFDDPDIESAQRSLEQAVRIDPANSGAWIALAAIYNHQGQYNEAVRCSERALAVAPNTWQGYMEMAKASIAQNMYQRALRFIRQAERLGGNKIAEVHLVKAYALMPMKLYKAARYELQASLSREPKGKVAQQAQTILAQLSALEQGETMTAQR